MSQEVKVLIRDYEDDPVLIWENLRTSFFFFFFFFESLFIVFMCGHYKTVRTSYSKDWCRHCAEVSGGKVTTVKRITFSKDSKGGPKG